MRSCRHLNIDAPGTESLLLSSSLLYVVVCCCMLPLLLLLWLLLLVVVVVVDEAWTTGMSLPPMLAGEDAAGRNLVCHLGLSTARS